MRYADGRVVEGELVEKLLVASEREPFSQISPTHVRAVAHFRKIRGRLIAGGTIEMLPERVEAKQKTPGMPWLVTIQGEGQTWETFFCDLTATQ